MIKKFGAAAMAALMFMAIFTGCTNERPVNTMSTDNIIEPEKGGDKVFNDAKEISYEEMVQDSGYTEFVFSVANQCSAGSDTNMMVSPASLLFAMEMAAAGANGQTLDEMSAVLVPGASNEEALGFASDYYSALNGTDEIKVSNGIFMNKAFEARFYSDYLNYITDNFGSQTDVREFDEDAVKYINDWVNDSTDGMIDEIIDSLDPSLDVAVLVNAIAFDGKWEKEYESGNISENRIFTNSYGEEEEVTMLCSTEDIFFETDKATGFMKYYEGGNYAFVAILPKDPSVSANEFLSDFSYEDYNEFIGSLKNIDVRTNLPEFEYDYSNSNMVEIFKKLGMETPFSMSADFSNISDVDVYISSIVHKTHIKVDREGTEAAAATAVTLTEKSAMVEPDFEEVILDRPFVYAIVDTATKTPVFLGTVNSVG